MRFVDTNVLLYSISTESDEAAKTATAQALMASRDIALSVQVLQEFHTWRSFPTQDITISILDDALAIKARYQLSYWDSAIIAAAKQAQCHEVLSEDMNGGQDYGGIKVVNPFKP